jgi:VanZ family protein
MRSSISLFFALSWLIVTTTLLCLPGSAFPQENWFGKIWLDKWIHIFLFGGLVFCWCRAAGSFSNRTQKLFMEIALYFILYGVAMELVQKYFIPNRSFDLKDITADTVGCAVGLFFSVRVYIKK